MQIILPGLYIGISSIAYIVNTAVDVFTYCSLLLDRSRYLRVHVGNFVNALANSIKSCSCFLCVSYTRVRLPTTLLHDCNSGLRSLL